MRPVRESLLASVWETSKARSIAKRSDALRATTSTSFSTASEGGEPSSVVTWKTPMELPPMLMGTQSAEQPRPRRLGQASSAVLSGEHHGPRPRCGRAVVGGHDPAPDVVGLRGADQHLPKVGLARIGQEQLGPHARGGLAQRLGHHIEDGRLRSSTSPVRSAGSPRKRSSGRCRIARPHGSRLLAFHLQRVPGEDRDHGAGDGDADGDGPQEVDPGPVCGRAAPGRPWSSAGR